MVTYSLKYKMMSMALAFSVLSGCGTVVPEIQELPGDAPGGQLLVKEIVHRVRCEVQEAVQNVYDSDDNLVKYNGRRTLAWFDDWGAQIALTLTVVEKSGFNPGATLNTPIITANTTFP